MKVRSERHEIFVASHIENECGFFFRVDVNSVLCFIITFQCGIPDSRCRIEHHSLLKFRPLICRVAQ